MKSYATKLQLKTNYSQAEFLALLEKVYHLPLTQFNFQKHFEIHDDYHIFYYDELHIIALHFIKEKVAFIYNYQDSIVYIHQNHPQSPIAYFINHQLIHDDNGLAVISEPISMNFHYFKKKILPNIYNNQFMLPIVYISRDINQKSPIDTQYLSQALRGFIHVIYERKSQIHRKTVPNAGRVDIYYMNHEHMTCIPYYHEKKKDFTLRILQQLEMYLQQRVFDFPYDFHALKQFHLQEIKKITQLQNHDIIDKLEKKMQILSNKKDSLIQNIQKLEKEINKFDSINSMLESQIISKSLYPILYKGHIEEYYEDEQKEVILNLIAEKLKNAQNHFSPQEEEMIYTLIKLNPSSKKRIQFLSQIRQITLDNRKVSPEVTTLLKKCHIHLEKCDKHYKAKFFNNNRYVVTISSTPRSPNALKESYRLMHDHFY